MAEAVEAMAAIKQYQYLFDYPQRYDPSLINPHYGINDRQPTNPLTDAATDLMTSLIQSLISNQNRTSPALAPVHRWIGLLRREYSEPPRGLEPHSHPLTEGSKGCGACQATML